MKTAADLPVSRPARARQVPRQLVMALVSVWGLVSCARLPAVPQSTPSTALAEPQRTALGRATAALAPDARTSGFRLIVSGDEAFDMRAALADQSERTLDLQYYIIDKDPSVRKLMARVLAAANRGVRVRILLDDMNTVGADGALRELAGHPRIEIRLFNPFPVARGSVLGRVTASLGDFQRINRRMHNKLFIADNAVAITGGRNLGDAYFVQSEEANFFDLDVVAAGPIVRNMSASFDDYWNNELSYPAEAITRRQQERDPASIAPARAASGDGSRFLRALRDGSWGLEWAPAWLLVDKPEKAVPDSQAAEDAEMFEDVVSFMKSAKRELTIVSPYFVPGSRGLALLQELRARGVTVRVMTNSLVSTDAPVVHVGYARYRRALLEAGVEIYEWGPRMSAAGKRHKAFRAFGSSRASLHAKVLVVDGRTVFIGSMNLDPRSAYANTEIGVGIRSARMAREVNRLFGEDVRDDCYRVTLTEAGTLQWTGMADGEQRIYYAEPEAGTRLRFQYWLMKPFAPEELL